MVTSFVCIVYYIRILMPKLSKFRLAMRSAAQAHKHSLKQFGKPMPKTEAITLYNTEGFFKSIKKSLKKDNRGQHTKEVNCYQW
jgi:hypothetical protein